MRRRASIDDPTNFMESFVDLLSCGLGAALLLFLIFATMPRSGSDRIGRAVPSRLIAERPSTTAPSPFGVQQLVLEIDAPLEFTRKDVAPDGVTRLDDRCDISQDERVGRRVLQFDCIATDGPLADRCVEVRMGRPGRVRVTVSKLTGAGRSTAGIETGVDGRNGLVSVWMDETESFLIADRGCR